jgi:hypothetical protein
LETGNIFQEYGDNFFKGDGTFIFHGMGLMCPIDHGVKGFLPPEITGLLNKLRASVLSMP